MEYAIKKAVVDTNIFISAFVYPSGTIREIIQLAMKRKIEIFVSGAILHEYSRVLQEKFNWTQEEIRINLAVISGFTRLCNPDIKLDVVAADDDDNKIIECAVCAGAEVIVSGDKHLLELQKYKNIRIIKPADFLRSII